MITQQKRNEIIANLKLVPTETVFGLGIQIFVENVVKTDEDYKRAVKDIKGAIADGPNYMKEILGESFNYFNTLQL